MQAADVREFSALGRLHTRHTFGHRLLRGLRPAFLGLAFKMCLEDWRAELLLAAGAALCEVDPLAGAWARGRCTGNSGPWYRSSCA